MGKFTEFDLEMAFNAGRNLGKDSEPDNNENGLSDFEQWLEDYVEDNECK